MRTVPRPTIPAIPRHKVVRHCLISCLVFTKTVIGVVAVTTAEAALRTGAAGEWTIVFVACVSMVLPAMGLAKLVRE